MMHEAPLCLFVTPARGGPPTGGNLYNDGLLAALEGGAELRFEQVELERAPMALVSLRPALAWVDSLYLEALPTLRRLAPKCTRLFLLAHYLPSWVRCGDGLTWGLLSDTERAALASVDGALATSSTMAERLRQLDPRLELFVAEPAVRVAPRRPRPTGALHALMLANLVPGKGVHGFLAALAHRLRDDDELVLSIIGRDDADPAYAAACRAEVAQSSGLARRVRFLGALEHTHALEALRGAHVLVSASRMESFGMALAEARAAGLVVLARRGGHVAAHVTEHAGGELVDDDVALAAALLTLVRDGELRETRARLAEQHARAPRSTREVAHEVVSIVRTLVSRKLQ